MKLLTQEELQGIDSTSATIAKWDEFLKKAVYNLGFSQDLIDNMYPYEKGIPKLDGSYLPVSKKTGRVFFQMSWADKLTMMMKNTLASRSNVYVSKWHVIATWLIYTCFYYPKEVAKEFFPTIPDIDVQAQGLIEEIFEYCKKDPDFEWKETEWLLNEKALHKAMFAKFILAVLSEKKAKDKYPKQELIKEIWRNFIENSITFVVFEDSSTARSMNPEDYNKEAIISLEDQSGEYNPSYLFIYNKTLADKYDKFPYEELKAGADLILGNGTNISTYLSSYGEVYNQDYLVLSLNPIDKLMCSTKQAFSSCMSISKQNETYGTSSSAALGLPALFPTDSVMMLFMTNGKHKNMYWEEEEWEKEPANRDKEKAYKYLKMTCRALTYQGYPQRSTTEYLRHYEDVIMNADYPEEQKEKYRTNVNLFNVDQPRLYVGRQYSAKGEDFSWEVFIEILLSMQDIATAWAYWAIASNLRKIAKQLELNISYEFRYRDFLCTGRLIDSKAICYDRFGFIRGIYYDNVSWVFKANVRKMSPVDTTKYTSPVDPEKSHIVVTGTNRTGSHGVSQTQVKTGCDMFKIMTGKQNYSYINASVKICSRCGEFLKGNEVDRVTTFGEHFCDKCQAEIGIKYCKHCGLLYKPSEAQEHTEINLRKITHPTMYQKIKPLMTCYNQLQKAEMSRMAFCANCGELKFSHYMGISRIIQRSITTPDGRILIVQFSICTDCMQKAVLCDKCKKVVIMNSVQDACVLLPNKRVICADCLDKVRLQQKQRINIKRILENISWKDVAAKTKRLAHDNKILESIQQDFENNTGTLDSDYAFKAQTKDITKQISSILTQNNNLRFDDLLGHLLSEEREDND